jgi:hypothetical protein
MAVKRKEPEKKEVSPEIPYHQAFKVQIQQLRKPKWYFKKDLSKQAHLKLRKSVERFGYGIICVRHFSLDIKEVIDGWRRVEIMRELGYPDDLLVFVQDYGKLPEIDAVILARNMNHGFGEIDAIEYSKSLNYALDLQEVNTGKCYSSKEISGMTPEARYQVDDILTLLDFDWKKFKDELSEDNFMRY